ncbi:ATP-binding cassette domain-containing protein [Lapidilactobacillus luobeiensis]|uniref:ATP-binding cassette domain-containing protein n=1 Tax=Lapidilactobacillus luobeiensis TaxID=2950371 RepID=UPI0021C401B3|nr:ABC transporter ATP-binding protein [Lapidilactobacillus luobeiensis]
MSIWKYIRLYWKINVLLLLIDIAGSLFVTIFSLGIADIMTALVNRSFTTILYWFIALAVICVAWGLQIFLHDKVYAISVQKMDMAIRNDICLLLEDVEYTSFHNENPSVYVSWLTNDISTINDYGFDCLELAISQAITVAMSAFAIFKFHYSLVLSTLLLLVIMYLVPKIFTKKMSANALSTTKTNESATKTISDFLSGFDELFMLNTPYLLHRAVKRSSEKLSQAKIRQATTSGMMHGSSNLTSFLSQVLIMAQSCVLFIMGLTSIGAISAARDFSSIIFSSTTGFFANLMEVRTTKPIFEKYSKLAYELEDSAAKVNISELSQSLSFNHVDFNYGNKTVLSDCSFSIKTRHKYVLSGESGSGKSTLFNLILKTLMPVSGQINYDGIPYSEISSRSVRNQIIYINQKPHIFNESIRFNITLDRDISKERLDYAIQASGLDALLDDLPEGLNTIINENGTDLSGGQVQRIAIARGLIQEKKIWLIDEATSALDPQSKADIENRLVSLPDVTMLMICHHITNILKKSVDGELHLTNKEIQVVDS